jgi:hypothetical protein
MKWQDLKNYIDTQSKDNKDFLKQDVCVYDYNDGQEHVADIIELLNEKLEDSDSGWVSYITINDEVEHGEVKKASIA